MSVILETEKGRQDAKGTGLSEVVLTEGAGYAVQSVSGYYG